ncbi:MAG: DL-endopeptidase inhibitor IseA family protein [Thermonemataceae bacterium]
MKTFLFYYFSIGFMALACQKTAEKEQESVVTRTSEEVSKDVLEKYYAKDLSVDGHYICKNDDGTVEELFIQNDGSEIKYTSNKLVEKIPLKIVDFSRESNPYQKEVAFLNVPKESYYLRLVKYAQIVECNNPSGTIQIFEKEVNTSPELFWKLIFRGQRLESWYHYINPKALQGELVKVDEEGRIIVKPTLDSRAKIREHLRRTYTQEATEKVIKLLKLKVKERKLTIPAGMGKNKAVYEEAYLNLLRISPTERQYELCVPNIYGRWSYHTINFQKEKSLWKLASITGMGYH